jgi:hypothetical protein
MRTPIIGNWKMITLLDLLMVVIVVLSVGLFMFLYPEPKKSIVADTGWVSCEALSDSVKYLTALIGKYDEWNKTLTQWYREKRNESWELREELAKLEGEK